MVIGGRSAPFIPAPPGTMVFSVRGLVVPRRGGLAVRVAKRHSLDPCRPTEPPRAGSPSQPPASGRLGPWSGPTAAAGRRNALGARRASAPGGLRGDPARLPSLAAGGRAQASRAGCCAPATLGDSWRGTGGRPLRGRGLGSPVLTSGTALLLLAVG